MNRDGMSFRPLGRIVRAVGICLLMALGFTAMPDTVNAFPGADFRPLADNAASPLLPAGYCADGRDDCPDYERGPYRKPANVHARRYESEPEPYVYREPVKVHREPVKEDCVEEERYAARHFVVREEPRLVRRSVESVGDDDFCGIRCWWVRLRNGYCGRGCDYYRFRMTEFPEGNLGRRHVRLACR